MSIRPADANAVPAGHGPDAEVDANAEAAWRAEIYRRLQQIDSGTAKLIPWQVVQRRLRARQW